MKYYKFACGCQFPIDQTRPPVNGMPAIIYDTDAIPLDCPKTWEIISRGLTKGVFQLESQLGRQWSKKLKPENMEHLAALAALLRPGCLQSKDDDGISMTEHYCRRKNGQEEVTYYHEALQPSLESTYGVLCFQEEVLDISKRIAGFNLTEADDLRRAVGKKKPELMTKVRGEFVNKAANLGVVSEEQASRIFDWIEKGQRYLFVKAHATAYALTGYHSAHAKTHFPLQFYTSYLTYAQEKQDPLVEIRELVHDAKLFDISVLPPSFTRMRAHFSQDGEKIMFGLTDVKGIGGKQVVALQRIVRELEQEMGSPCTEWTWYTFMTRVSSRIPSQVIKKLIEVGALRDYRSDRQRMLAEFEAWSALTEKEQEVIIKSSEPIYRTERSKSKKKDAPPPARVLVHPGYQPDDLVTAIEGLLERGTNLTDYRALTSTRKTKVQSVLSLLKNPPRSLDDTPDWIAKVEEEALGIALTTSRLHSCDTSIVNTTCKQFRDGKDGDCLILAVEVQDVREWTIKKGARAGEKMAFLAVCDETGSIDDVTMFTNEWSEYGCDIWTGAPLIIQGQRDYKRGGLIVDKVWRA